MGEFYLPLENCRVNIDGKVPRTESAPTQKIKNLYRTNVSQDIRRVVSRILRGIYVGYPAKVTNSCNGVRAVFEVKGIKEHLRVKDLSRESKYLKEFFSLLQSDDVFWDVGAYVGVWSLLAAKKNPAVEVYSFEPEPECFQALKHNVEFNRLNGRVKTIPIAISDSFQPASLACSGREGQCASLQAANGYLYHQPIHTYSVDNVIGMDWAPKPTVMKIDVEGAEGLVIEGISRQNRPEHLFVELHPDFLTRSYQTTPAEVWNNILALDYQPVHVWQRGPEILSHFALESING